MPERVPSRKEGVTVDKVLDLGWAHLPEWVSDQTEITNSNWAYNSPLKLRSGYEQPNVSG